MNLSNEVIRISWEEWKAGRAEKRETLRKLGLDAPSRRPFGHDDRLRSAFDGARVPSFSSSHSLHDCRTSMICL